MRDPSNIVSGEKESKAGCLAVVGWVFLAGIVTLILTLLVVWRSTAMVTTESRRIAEAVAADFKEALNLTPEVQVDAVVVVAATTPTLELVTAKKQALVRYRWSQTWMHSTKNLEIEATFTARAGFDFETPLRIKIDPLTKWINTEIPMAKILSMDMGEVRILRDEDGFWNRLTEKDREDAFRGLRKKAEEEFADSDFLTEARLEGEKRIREVLQKSGAHLEVNPSSIPAQ